LVGAVGRGDASLSNFRIVLMDNTAAVDTEFLYDAPPYPRQITIPFASISRAELEQDTGYDIMMVLKDLRVIRLGFMDGKKFANQFIGVLSSYAFPTDVKHLFAFSRYSKIAPPSETAKKGGSVSVSTVRSANDMANITKNPSSTTSFVDGWQVFTPAKEFTRQGLLGSSNTKWRLWQDNYELSPTYPSAFILPAVLTDVEVRDAAKFRSKARMPALTWCSPVTGMSHVVSVM
jgi:hypothetical protein